MFIYNEANHEKGRKWRIQIFLISTEANHGKAYMMKNVQIFTEVIMKKKGEKSR